MRQIYKSWLAALILVLIFFISFLINYESDFSYFCKADSECLLDLSYETNNPQLCDLANDTNFCYTKAALYFDYPLLCDKIENNSECYLKYSIVKNNPQLCSNTNSLQDKCLFEIGIAYKNMKVCDLANNSGLCYYSYAIHYNESQICDLSEKYKSICYEKLIMEGDINESN